MPAGGGGRCWAGVARSGVLPGASGAQVGPMRSVCAEGEAALLGPARAAYAVTLKSRQQARVLVDRQWQKVLGDVQVKGVLDTVRNAVGEVHLSLSLGRLGDLLIRKWMKAAVTLTANQISLDLTRNVLRPPASGFTAFAWAI